MASQGEAVRGPKVMIAGGGTGGHVFPAVAVCQALEALNPEVEVIFVGTARGMEARVVPALGRRLETLAVRPLKGGGLAGRLRGLLALPTAGFQAAGLLWRERPSVVVSVGGYAAGPVTALAALAGIPTALLEQNAMPGMTNRLLGRRVDRCFLSLPDMSGTLPTDRSEVVGNPLRRELLARAAEGRPDRAPGEGFRVFITGGSGGAGALNEGLPRALRRLDDGLAGRLVVRHQAGRGRAQPVDDAYRGFAGQVEVVEFVDDMADAYRWADLVICRAGATTLAEVFAMGVAAMLIPFAGAADNHQEKNALSAVQAGAAVMVKEAEIEGGRLERLLEGLVRNPESLEGMRRQAVTLGRPEAAEVVARALLEMAGAPVEEG